MCGHEITFTLALTTSNSVVSPAAPTPTMHLFADPTGAVNRALIVSVIELFAPGASGPMRYVPASIGAVMSIVPLK